MKFAKIAVVAVVAFGAFAFASAVSAVSASSIYTPTTGYLKTGSGMGAMAYQAPQVMAAQTALNACVPGTALTLDGKMGPLTTAKFKAFQASKMIAQDGVIGPVTAAQLEACSGNQPTNPGTTPTTGGSLSGGAGNIDTIDQVSSDVEDEILEGAEEEKVLGFDIEAEGSDLEITSIRVAFEHTGAGSDRLDRYVDNVSVWFDGEEVGSEDADDFSESNDVYTKSITLDGVVIEENEEGRIYVAINAVSSIDSDDQGEDWTVSLEQVRYEDATGAILTETVSSIDEVFSFEDLASSGDLNFRVKESSDNVEEQTVEVDEDGGDEVLLLEAEIEAKGSDMTVDSMQFDVVAVGANINQIASEFMFSVGGDELDSINASTVTGTSNTITFTDLEDDLELEDGDSITVQVWAKIKEIDGSTFQNGDSLTVSLDSANRDAADVEDENGDQVDNSDKSGTISGEAQAFAEEGISVAVLSGSKAVRNGNTGEFTFVLDITAFGDTATDLTIADFDYSVVAPGGSTASFDEDLSDEENNIEENSGTYTFDDETGEITFTVYVTTDANADAGVYKITLDEVAGAQVDKSLSVYVGFNA